MSQKEVFKSLLYIMCVSASCATLLGVSACSARGSLGGWTGSSAEKAHLHQVKHRGETLSGIAKWYTGSAGNWESLRVVNVDQEPNRLQLGQIVNIPAELLKRSDPPPGSYFRSQSAKRGTGSRGLAKRRKSGAAHFAAEKASGKRQSPSEKLMAEEIVGIPGEGRLLKPPAGGNIEPTVKRAVADNSAEVGNVEGGEAKSPERKPDLAQEIVRDRLVSDLLRSNYNTAD